MGEPERESTARLWRGALGSRASVRFLVFLGGVSLVALVVRLLVCRDFSTHLLVVSPPATTDMATYQALAKGILAGQWPEPFYYQPFYYSVFLPVIYGLLGTGPWSIMAVQAVVGAGTVFLVGLLGARLFGRRAGLLAAGLLALARFHIFYTPFALMAVLQGFWVVLIGVCTLGAWRRNRWSSWLWLGLVLAAGVLTRGNLLLFLPVAVLVLWWRNRCCRVRAGLYLSLLVVACILPQLPFAWHNSRHCGRVVGPSTAKDAVMALGNTPESPVGGLAYPATYRTWMAAAEREGAERESVTRQVLRWIAREPLAFLELKWRMFLLFWYPAEIPNNISYDAVAGVSGVLRSNVLIDFGWLAVLAISGMVVAVWTRRHSPCRLALVGYVWVYCVGTVMFYILARFRLPVVPVLCVFAGYGVEYLLLVGGSVWHRRTVPRRLLYALLVLGGASLFVYRGYPYYQQWWSGWAMTWARPNGVIGEDGERCLLYDQGPELLGGWQWGPAVTRGVVRKVFCPAKRFQGSAWVVSGVRLPVVSGQDSVVEVVVSHSGERLASGRATFSGELRKEWLELSFANAVPVTPTVEVTLQVQGLRGGFMLAFDALRNYRRTWVLGQGGAFCLHDQELCIQLILSPVEAPGKVGKEPATGR